MDKVITKYGMIHVIRKMGEVVFVLLRNKEGLLQCVLEQEKEKIGTKMLVEEMSVCVIGTIRNESRAPDGIELLVSEIQVLSKPKKPLPLPIGKWKISCSLEKKIDLRPVSLRNIREQSIFKLQEGIIRAFREYLYQKQFTEIQTPKLSGTGSEGGSNLFHLDYFGKKAVLSQSPQLYKQIMTAVYERVFETGPVFRAEKHSTTRHLNEYTSLDFEMAYIEDFTEIMDMEIGFLTYAMDYIGKEYAKECELLSITIPDTKNIPSIRFEEAKQLVATHYQKKSKSPYDLEPEEERLIGMYYKETYGKDFVFITHYPAIKRPFYAMEDPKDPSVTLSFDLLFCGVEITTGGQRIHEYDMLLEKMRSRGIEEESIYFYMSAFQYGMPPHGGLGIGLERFVKQLLGLENIKEAALFPRDQNRLVP